MTIYNLKAIIKSGQNKKIKELKLVNNGRELLDNQQLGEVGIEEGGTVQIIT